MRTILSKTVQPVTNIRYNLLQQLLDKFKEIRPVLKMHNYVSGVNDNLCATSCCIAGWGMEWKIGTTDAIDRGWNMIKSGETGPAAITTDYIDIILQSDDKYLTDHMFDWMFGGNWKNDHTHAIQRMEYFITKRSVPLVYTSHFYSNISLYEAIQALDTISYGTVERESIAKKDFVYILPSRILEFYVEEDMQMPEIPYEYEMYPINCVMRYVPLLAIHKDELPKFFDLIADHSSFD